MYQPGMSEDGAALNLAEVSQTIQEWVQCGMAIGYPDDFLEQLAQEDIYFVDVLSMLRTCRVERLLPGGRWPNVYVECDGEKLGAQVALMVRGEDERYVIVKRVWRLDRGY